MNKTRLLLYALCLGILVGATIFSHDPFTPTGQAIANCYLENEPCICGPDYCKCGDENVSREYCYGDLNS